MNTGCGSHQHRRSDLGGTELGRRDTSLAPHRGELDPLCVSSSNILAPMADTRAISFPATEAWNPCHRTGWLSGIQVTFPATSSRKPRYFAGQARRHVSRVVPLVIHLRSFLITPATYRRAPRICRNNGDASLLFVFTGHSASPANWYRAYCFGLALVAPEGR